MYLVATPIGNLRDITLRALDTLRAADIIACEDTRRTRPLLTHFGITGTLVAYHDHNEDKAAQRLVGHMEDGLSVALVSDAGTPLISDPGFGLVAATRAAGLPVTAIPGPSAPLLALQLSGLASDRFCFVGFPPTRQGARKTAFAELASIPASLIFFESPRRLADSLADMAAVFGPRPACVARELTKLHEEVRTGPLPDLAGLYDKEGPPKGEVVIVVDAPGESEPISPENLDALLQAALADQPVRDAAAGVASVTGLSRKEVYERALILTGKKRAPQT
ncbi:MAG: 16S rRNA (cytidine(1402)-2'-O)-methyltransferase [Pseudomonadota bacterium]